VTIAVVLVRSGLDGADPAPATTGTSATTTVSTRPAQTNPPTKTTGTTPAAGTRFYRVESGDTLESIAAEHDTSVEALLTLNPNVDPVALTVGQRIRVA
jgi:LysM repeat protein